MSLLPVVLTGRRLCSILLNQLCLRIQVKVFLKEKKDIYKTEEPTQLL